jgi:hypothetical protein
MEMGPVWRTITFRLNFHLKQEGTCFNSPVRPAGELMNAGGSLSDQDAVEIEVLQHHFCRLRNLRQTVCVWRRRRYSQRVGALAQLLIFCNFIEARIHDRGATTA